jgi:prepilin-type N-terminal cleavage/methylation domain-containing protein
MNKRMNNTTIRANVTAGARAAFTLVEVLVVIVIISLLLTIAVPSIQKIRVNIIRTQCFATVHLLSAACEYFKVDDNGGMYPPSAGGCNTLVQALTGYRDDDGEPGFGWRAAPGGAKKGPYNGAENVATRNNGGKPVFIDSFKNDILYYRFDTTSQSYNASDNTGLVPGDINNYVKSQGGTFLSKTFAIITPGADGQYTAKAMDPGSDDIANFLPE